MRRFFQFISENIKIVSRLGLFFLTVVLIVLLFPKEGKFRYEFYKGKPWVHEALIAPFDFPIYKSDDELNAEKDSLLKDFKPYFNYNTKIEKEQLQKYNRAFEKLWNRSVLNPILPGTSPAAEADLEKLKVSYNTYGANLLDFIYSRGVLEVNELVDKEVDKDQEINVIKNKIAQAYDFTEILTPKSAYELILHKINTDVDNLPNALISRQKFFREINLDEFISPNLFYDKQTSDKVKQSIVGEVSLTRGMRQKGERIVSRGDIVNGEVFQVLESLKRESESRLGQGANYYIIMLGQAILVMISIFVIYLFFRMFRVQMLNSTVKLTFLLFLIIIIIFVSSVTLQFNPKNFYIIPFALVPIIIKTFFDTRMALYIHMVAMLLIGFFAPNSFEFVFTNSIVGIIAIFSLTNVYRRAKLVITAIFVALTYSVIYFGMSIIQEGDIYKIEPDRFIFFGVNGLMVLLAYPFIFIFEKLFGFLSDTTLMELSDINQPLLRQLAEVAPGTFQHSLQVATLAEEAVLQTGGNPLLVKIGALYHDIGKMERPGFFIENQSGDINPHDDLEYEQSAEIIISHVIIGVEIAKKHKLPEPIIDFIRTHHGTSMVQYFYKSHLKKYPDKEVDRGHFTYPGPKPTTKEMAVLMMADSVEAASRSLKILNEKTIKDLVDEIINGQFAEEQFSEANITFREISLIKEIFKKKLRNIHHARIVYPK
jgi:cyclic-di-AMP phosphodiesterase PgpH